jgi:hypothetical protein
MRKEDLKAMSTEDLFVMRERVRVQEEARQKSVGARVIGAHRRAGPVTMADVEQAIGERLPPQKEAG